MAEGDGNAVVNVHQNDNCSKAAHEPSRPLYGKVELNLGQCILPLDKLSFTPSMRDGLSGDDEKDLRILGCELIQSSGILLRLPQVSI